MESRKIYNRIALLRQESAIGRKELAEMIGVNFQTVGYLEREEYNPSLDLAFRIAEVFKKPVDFIFSTEPLRPLSELAYEKYLGGKNEEAE
ncbi:MAG: helix-turn-helix transcriptional regulator [Candidatus Delongbacteria bacterium]|nr:helix-turn-helix transcriptional regulator [Candidatus Delongbacteria bacterium]